jgi:hypothetical protein
LILINCRLRLSYSFRGTLTGGLARGNVINLENPRLSNTFGTLNVIWVPATEKRIKGIVGISKRTDQNIECHCKIFSCETLASITTLPV